MIDLKRVEIKHGDIGQMNLYLNYFENAICQPDDNSPVGIVLGTKKDKLLMEYALQGIDNQLFAIRYQQRLPNREELQAQLNLLLDNTKEINILSRNKIRELRDEQGLLQRQQAVILEINTPMFSKIEAC